MVERKKSAEARPALQSHEPPPAENAASTPPNPHEHDSFVSPTEPARSVVPIVPPPLRLLAEQILAGKRDPILGLLSENPKAALAILGEHLKLAKTHFESQPQEQATRVSLREVYNLEFSLSNLVRQLEPRQAGLYWLTTPVFDHYNWVNKLLEKAQLPTIEDAARTQMTGPELYKLAKVKYINKSPIFGDLVRQSSRDEQLVEAMYQAALQTEALTQSFSEVLAAAPKEIATQIAPKFNFDAELYGGPTTQDRFHLSSAYYVQKAAEKILAGDSGLNMLLYLGACRRQQAMELKHESSDKFGAIRATTLRSDVAPSATLGNPNYVPYFEAVKKKVESNAPQSQDPDEPLTYMKMFWARDAEGHYLRMRHTPPERIFELMKRFSDEFDKIQRKNYPANDEGSAELLQDLGSLHWILAIATPFLRGSAAVGENLIRSLLLAKGRTIENFKVMPDLEAFLKNRKSFAAEYAGVFSTPPTLARFS